MHFHLSYGMSIPLGWKGKLAVFSASSDCCLHAPDSAMYVSGHCCDVPRHQSRLPTFCPQTSQITVIM